MIGLLFSFKFVLVWCPQVRYPCIHYFTLNTNKTWGSTRWMLWPGKSLLAFLIFSSCDCSRIDWSLYILSRKLLPTLALSESHILDIQGSFLLPWSSLNSLKGSPPAASLSPFRVLEVDAARPVIPERLKEPLSMMPRPHTLTQAMGDALPTLAFPGLENYGSVVEEDEIILSPDSLFCSCTFPRVLCPRQYQAEVDSPDAWYTSTSSLAVYPKDTNTMIVSPSFSIMQWLE